MSNIVFNAIPESNLREVLENLHKYTQLPIRLFNSEGEILLSYGDYPQYCSCLQSTIFSAEDCMHGYMKAGQTALGLGEAYIFSCRCNLNHILFPLVNEGELIGSVLIGPFLMDTPDSTIVAGIAEKYSADPALSLELYDCLTEVQVVVPTKVSNLKILTDYLLSYLIPGEKAVLLRKQQQLYQQSRISESIQAYKGESDPSDLKFRYEKEKELLSVVKSGDVKNAKRLLNELLGNAIFCGGGAAAVRMRAIELTTLLSRVAMDGGAKPESIYIMSSRYISMLGSEESLEDMCMILQDVVENFMSAAFFEKDGGNLYIREALRYISENYRSHIELQTVAEHVGISASYFSSLFNSTVGMSFKDYVNYVRIEEGKRLLMSTDYDLANIAVFLGYPDQSYFCKVFKRLNGVSPGKFRHI